MNASQFVLFTDTDGIFTDNPKINSNAKHIQEIKINEIDIVLSDVSSGLGSGGMKAKLAAAISVKKLGIDTMIANGTDLHPLRNLVNKEKHTLLKE